MKKTLFLILSIMLFTYSCSSDDDNNNEDKGVVGKNDTFIINTNVKISDNLPNDSYTFWFEIPNDKLVSYDTGNKHVNIIKGETNTIIALNSTSFDNFVFTFQSKDFSPNFVINLNIDDKDEPDDIKTKLTGNATVTKNNTSYIENTYSLDYFNSIVYLKGQK